jgi:hypothetical protein
MEKRKLSELLPLCKFYCGSENPPAFLKPEQVDFFRFEQEWVRFMLNGMDDEFDSENILYYTHYVTPLMSDLHDAPLSLMAYMFVRSGKYSFSLEDHAPWFVEQIQKWYK